MSIRVSPVERAVTWNSPQLTAFIDTKKSSTSFTVKSFKSLHIQNVALKQIYWGKGTKSISEVFKLHCNSWLIPWDYMQDYTCYNDLQSLWYIYIYIYGLKCLRFSFKCNKFSSYCYMLLLFYLLYVFFFSHSVVTKLQEENLEIVKLGLMIQNALRLYDTVVLNYNRGNWPRTIYSMMCVMPFLTWHQHKRSFESWFF